MKKGGAGAVFFMHAWFDTFIRAFANLGGWVYLVAALIAFGESVILVSYFLPGVMIMAFLGFLCYLEVYDFRWMLLAATIGHFGGEMTNYYLGLRRGRDLFSRHNRFLRLDVLERVERAFHEGAVHIMIVGHFIGLLRPIVSFTAGMTRYALPRFLGLMSVLTFVWALTHLGVGYVLGASWAKAAHYLNRISLGVGGAVLVIAAAGWLVRRRRKQRNERTQ